LESPDFYAIFASAPGSYLIITPDENHTIIAVNDAYLAATLTTREQLIGVNLFDAFPDNPADPNATGVRNLRASLQSVVSRRAPHTMAVQKYDIRRPDGRFEERYWSPINTPVPGKDGKAIACIVHCVQDVTEIVRLKHSHVQLGKVNAALKQQVHHAGDATDSRVRAAENQLQESNALLAEYGQRLLAEAALRKSDERFRGFVTASFDAVYQMNADWTEMKSLQGREFIADTTDASHTWIEKYIHPDDRSMVLAAVAAAIRNKSIFQLEHRILRADGSLGWTNSRAVPLLDDRGEIIEWIGAASDITDRKRDEVTLRDMSLQLELQHRLFEQIASTTPDFIYVFDLNGRFLYANRRLLEVWGTTFERAVGKSLIELGYPQWHADMHMKELRQVIDTRQPIKGEVPFTGGSGISGVYEYIFTPVLGPDGEVEVIAGTTRDVTERKQLMANERTARAEAERASRMKDEFLATLSHELRTPLNAILGWAEILRGGSTGTEDLREGLDTIARNARVQTQIIEDLLDMSRIIAGKVRLDVQRLNLADVVQAAIDTLRPAAEAKQIRLQVVLDPLAGPVSADPNRLQQVFWNLLTNAVKFTPRGGRVQVLLERINSHLEVSVVDTGEGIAPDFLPYVFERFRQSDASTTRRHGGLGLGLAIVKQLVELHGGSVRARSAGLVGQGSTFTVCLPLTVLHGDAMSSTERRHPSAGSGPINPQACAQLTDVKILVVDDEPDARALIKRLLEDCEAAVTVAASAAEAFDLLRSALPDVLISDVGMPQEDGYSFIRRVRALGAAEGGAVPAVALTAYARSEDRMSAIRAGFQHHVAKPVEPAELITIVASLVRR
jgi:PAS domain S-box-containing protein